VAGTSIGVATLLAIACAAPVPPDESSPDRLSLGPIVGDVEATRAVLWARAPRAGAITFEIDPAGAELAPAVVGADTDFTASVPVGGLRPETEYLVRARFEAGPPGKASFRTAPAASAPRPVRIAWGGDLAGQNVCRDAARGFPAFEGVARYAPDLFIGLGDMIYADAICEARGTHGNDQVPGDYGVGTDLASYRAHWRYTREDPAFAGVLAVTPYVAIWDDHEIVNDAGPLHDTRREPPWAEGVHLLPIGLRAFLEYNPIGVDAERTPDRLYRALRWGRHVELFVLDTRQYRDANTALDLAPAADAVGEVRRAKSLLGREQRTWLERSLAASDATWRVIVSSVPLAIPTGSPPERGRDGWAAGRQDTGFARERDDILRFLHANGVRDTLWITTDVHFAQVFVHRPVEGDPGFRVIEAVSGPLSAIFGAPRPPDPALQPEILFLHAAPDGANEAPFDEAVRWFNFGAFEVDAAGALTVRILDATGESLFAERFAPGE
jgi:alkaline phosphatase D